MGSTCLFWRSQRVDERRRICVVEIGYWPFLDSSVPIHYVCCLTVFRDAVPRCDMCMRMHMHMRMRMRAHTCIYTYMHMKHAQLINYKLKVQLIRTAPTRARVHANRTCNGRHVQLKLPTLY